MQLTHTFKDGFARVFISLNSEGRIFRNHLTNRDTHFLRAAFIFWRYRNRNYRLREYHGFKSTRVLLITEGMTCLHIFHTNNSDNIARLCAIYLVALIGVHFHHATNTLGFAREGVKDGIALIYYAGIDTSKGECAKAVIHNFESQCA